MKYTNKNLKEGKFFLMVTKEQIKELVENGVIPTSRINSSGCTSVCFEIRGRYMEDGWMDDDGSWYREQGYTEIKIDDLLINKKQTNMTTKSINIAAARKWPTKDLENGQKFLTKQGEIQIVKNKSSIYVVHNNFCASGAKPRSMPSGFKYGYILDRSPFKTLQNLTCGARFSAFKQQVEDTRKMQFSGEFKVSGAPSLLKALKEEAEEIGWKYVGEEINKNTEALSFEKGNFGIASKTGIDYVLALDWEYTIKALKDMEEINDAEYLLCVQDSVQDGITEGRIYKRDMSNTDVDYYELEEVDFDYGQTNWSKYYFVPSTKEEYEGQGVNISSIGGYKINIKEVKINGYEPMKMVCIGCIKSQQVYSLGALQVIYDVMCDSIAEYEEEALVFSKEQVVALIRAVS